MFVMLVYVHVKKKALEDFLEASLLNAEASRLEPGVVRFDVIQQADDPARFLLIEIYRDEGAPARHKESPHYLHWRETIEPMMAEPRQGVRYTILSPNEDTWG